MVKSKRDVLIDTALELFLQEGFHATGIDKILKEANVAKMTLYNHFTSKEELVLEALRRRDETFRDWLSRRTAERAETAGEQLRAMFDTLDEWFQSPTFSGCMFINVAAEYAEQDEPAHVLARQHKELVFDYILDLCKKAGAKEPENLANAIMLIAEGAIVMAYVANDTNAAANGKAAADKLCEQEGI